MAQTKVTFTPHLDPKINKKGTAKLYIRVTLNRKSKYLPTSIFLKPEWYDKSAKKVKNVGGAVNARKQNQVIASILSRMEGFVLEMESRGLTVTHDQIKRKYHGKENHSFIEMLEERIEKDEPVLKRNTLKNYRSTLNHIAKFSPDLTLHDISAEWLERFRNYLLKECGLTLNGANVYLVCIRKIVRKAFLNGKLENYPFADFKIRYSKKEREYLTIDELNSLLELYHSRELETVTVISSDGRCEYSSGKSYQRVLGHFLISCFSGLRYCDVFKLRRKHVIGGQIEIELTKARKGDNRKVRIPIQRQLRSLLNLDGDLHKPLVEGEVMTNQHTNIVLKKVMKIAGIQKHITFHMARHTFAVTALQIGIPIEVISNILGHSDIRITQIYARVVDKLRNQEMMKWDKLDSFSPKPSPESEGRVIKLQA